MKTGEFLEQVNHNEVVAAIRAAELRTSGEIRVFVSHKPVEDPVATAKSHFVRLGMKKTSERNGVLIFVAPRSQNFAILGDAAIHDKCGQPFWDALSAELSAQFKKGNFTAGLVQAIARASHLLAAHFPRRPDDRNELPDDVDED